MHGGSSRAPRERETGEHLSGLLHVSTVLGLRRKHRVTPTMFGAPVRNLTYRVCYLAYMR